MNSFNIKTFWNQVGWIRNLIFIVFIIIYNLAFRSYVISQADQFLESNDHFGTNPLFGLVMFLLFLLETVALFFAVKHLSYLKYLSLERGDQSSGCLIKLNEFILGVGIYFHIIYGIFVELIITNSSANGLMIMITLVLLLVREVYFLFKLWAILYDPKKEKLVKTPLTPKQLNFVSISLTLTSVVFFNVSWDLLISQLDGMIIFSFFLAFILYLPIRIFFVLEDYLVLQTRSERNKAILSSLLIIAFAVFSAIIYS